MELNVGMYIRSKDKNGVQYIRKIVELFYHKQII